MADIKRSAGLLVFRRTGSGVEVLLGHMGGPFWARKDSRRVDGAEGRVRGRRGAWDAALREFREELGLPAPEGTPLPLGEVVQSGGKHVTVWAVEGDLDPADVVPGTFTMEWPRGSGRTAEFPELDRVAWFGLDAARGVVVKAQAAFLDRLAERA